MKQKRTYVTLLLVLAILVLGIAYAAYTADILTINGTATAAVADGEVAVEFTAVAPAKADDLITYGEITEDPDVATLTVAGLKKAGDTQTVTYTITNKTANGVPVTLENPTIKVDNDTWYEVTYEYGTTALKAAGETGDSTTLAVTVKLLKTVATTADETAANTNNTITITLNAVAANS